MRCGVLSCVDKDGANDGVRTRDHRNHNPGLYQLSYVRHEVIMMVRPTGLEPVTLGFIPLQFSLPNIAIVCGLDHIFAVAGMVRMASTDPRM